VGGVGDGPRPATCCGEEMGSRERSEVTKEVRDAGGRPHGNACPS
jgi:hypothetical protein